MEWMILRESREQESSGRIHKQDRTGNAETSGSGSGMENERPFDFGSKGRSQDHHGGCAEIIYR